MTSTRPPASFRIDPFDLQLFLGTVEAGSITAGAARMHLSLAAASTRIKGLEHALGAVLLMRSKRGVQPTDAGRALRRHAGRLLGELEALHAEMASHARGVRSTVRVLANTAATSEHLPGPLGRFLERHPDIDVELRELSSPDVLMSMRLERADVGIVADYVGTEQLEIRRFASDRLVALLPANQVPARRRVLSFAELLDRPFVGLPMDSGLSRFLQGQALQHGKVLHHRVRMGGFEAVVRLVESGAGIAIVPASAAQRHAGDRAVARPLKDAWARRQLLLCTLAGETLGAGARRLVEWLAPRSEAR